MSTLPRKGEIKGLQFEFMGNDSIVRGSAGTATNFEQGQFGTTVDTIQSTLFGAAGNRNCSICGKSEWECHGHHGHMSLFTTPYMMYTKYIQLGLMTHCMFCSESVCTAKGKAIPLQRLHKVLRKQKNLVEKMCTACGRPVPDKVDVSSDLGVVKVTFKTKAFDSTEELEKYGNAVETVKDGKFVVLELSPAQVYKILSRIPNSQFKNLVAFNIVLTANTVRPSTDNGNRQHCQNFILRMIGKTVHKIENARPNADGTVSKALRDYRYLLNNYMQCMMFGESASVKQGKVDIKSHKKELSGKEGLVRGHMSSKRTGKSARSVVRGWSNHVDTLCVPEGVAKVVTIKVIVNEGNIDRLRKLVLNGHDVYPGANSIEPSATSQSKTTKYILKSSNLEDRAACLEVGDAVHRHLQNEDLVIFNRQPSLHKVSMMGMRVKVMPGSTFVISHSVTNPFNADFDGDEMNAFTQDDWRSHFELFTLCTPTECAISPVSSSPYIGLIQNSVLASYMLTHPKYTVSRVEAEQILATLIADGGDVTLEDTQTGKQVFSNLLNGNIELSHGGIRISKGQLVENGEQLKKKHLGLGKGVMYHMWQNLGHKRGTDFLHYTDRVASNMLEHAGFSIGYGDFASESDKFVRSTRQILDEDLTRVEDMIYEYIQASEKRVNRFDANDFEQALLKNLSNIRAKVDNAINRDINEDNRLRVIVHSGSRGKPSNITVCVLGGLLGQMTIGSERFYQRRATPFVCSDDIGADAKGFVRESYTQGLSLASAWAHAYPTREGIGSTANTTAIAGYLGNRTKTLTQPAVVQYDGTVGSIDGQTFQPAYGTGIHPEHHSSFGFELMWMTDKKLEQTYLFTSPSKTVGYSAAQQKVVEKELKAWRTKLQALYHANKHYVKGFGTTVPIPVHLSAIVHTALKMKFRGKYGTRLAASAIQDTVQKAIDKLHRMYPAYTVGFLPAALWIELCPKVLLNKRSQIKRGQLMWIVQQIFNRMRNATVYPGLAVGIWSAQTFCRQATQSALDSFHSAGGSAGDLGLSKLNELINVSGNPKSVRMKLTCEQSDDVFVNEIVKEIVATPLSKVLQKYRVLVSSSAPTTFERYGVSKEAPFWFSNGEQTVDNLPAAFPFLLVLEFDNNKLYQNNITATDICIVIAQTWIAADGGDARIVDTRDAKKIFKGVDRIGIFRSTHTHAQTTVFVYFKLAGLSHTLRSLQRFAEDLTDKAVIGGLKNTHGSTKQQTIDKIFIEQEEVMQEYTPQQGLKTETVTTITTDGGNLFDVCWIKGIDHSRIQINHVHAVFATFGIEAARECLIGEFRKIFGCADLEKNQHQFTLLVDMICHDGRKLCGATRHGINSLDYMSILTRASFEETVKQLSDACMYKKRDTLHSIESSTIMGKIAPVGTGMYRAQVDTETYTRAYYKHEYHHTAIHKRLKLAIDPVLVDVYTKYFASA